MQKTTYYIAVGAAILGLIAGTIFGINVNRIRDARIAELNNQLEIQNKKSIGLAFGAVKYAETIELENERIVRKAERLSWELIKLESKLTRIVAAADGLRVAAEDEQEIFRAVVRQSDSIAADVERVEAIIRER